MGFGDHVHWYIGGNRCNLDCLYCFMDVESPYDEFKVLDFAHFLVDTNTKKVTLGGGEPTLVKKLPEVLRILKEGNIEVSLHTNGTTLDSKKIKSLTDFVDNIALPIDSCDYEVQRFLRGDQFMPTYTRLLDLADEIRGRGMSLSWHTVFTMMNHTEMSRIYKKISESDFKNWRIYEFNDHLTIQTLNMGSFCQSPEESENFLERLEKIKSLRGTGDLIDAKKDPLFPLFRISQEEMEKGQDSRVQFVAINECDTYTFLNNAGNILCYDCFGGGIRQIMGNVFTDNVETISKRISIHQENLIEDPRRHNFEYQHP